MAKYQEYNQEQSFLIPFDVDVNIPKGSFVRFINDFFEEHTEIEKFEIKRKNDFGGKSAKHYLMMLKIIFYGYSQGIYFMREISEKYLRKHIEFIYLSGNQYVDHSTLSRFINMYREEIIEVFAKSVYAANNLGYIRKDLIAIDSTPIKANASHKFTGNVKIFKKKKDVYEKMIEGLLERSRRLEAEEKSKEEKDDENRKINRLKKEYKGTLNKINEFLKEAEKEDGEEKKNWLNLTDQDSELIHKQKKYLQGYSCQAGIDGSGIVITNDLSEGVSDQLELKKMVISCSNSLRELGNSEKEIKSRSYLLDGGYANSRDIGELSREGYDIYIPLKDYGRKIKDGERIQTKHCKLSQNKKGVAYITCPGEKEIGVKKKNKKCKGSEYYVFSKEKTECKECKYYSRCAGTLKANKKDFSVKKDIIDYYEELEKIKKKMKSWHGKNKYHKRLWMPEHIFGIIKERMKFKQFMVRGREKVQQQWNMVCTSVNLRKIWALSQV